MGMAHFHSLRSIRSTRIVSRRSWPLQCRLLHRAAEDKRTRRPRRSRSATSRCTQPGRTLGRNQRRDRNRCWIGPEFQPQPADRALDRERRARPSHDSDGIARSHRCCRACLRHSRSPRHRHRPHGCSSLRITQSKSFSKRQSHGSAPIPKIVRQEGLGWDIERKGSQSPQLSTFTPDIQSPPQSHSLPPPAKPA